METNGQNGSELPVVQRTNRKWDHLKATQFKPGQSGNPNGTPKRARFENYANEKDAALAYKKLVTAVRADKEWAICYYLDQYFGKARQRTEITGQDGNPIEYRNAAETFDRRLLALISAGAAGNGNGVSQHPD